MLSLKREVMRVSLSATHCVSTVARTFAGRAGSLDDVNRGQFQLVRAEFGDPNGHSFRKHNQNSKLKTYPLLAVNILW